MTENDREAIAHYQRKCANGACDPEDGSQELSGFASAAANEARLRTIEALGVSACADIRIRGHRHRVLPVSFVGWSAGELEEIARGER